jgi:hypothetical protein
MRQRALKSIAGSGSLGIRTVNIDGPYGSVMSVVCSETLSVVREPDVDDVVF